MTRTNSPVCSETVTEIWRAWAACGNCVSGPEQYVKTCVPLKTRVSPPVVPTAPQQVSSSLSNTWLRCLSSFSRCASVSQTSLHSCLCSWRPRKGISRRRKEVKVCTCVMRRGACVCVCVFARVYFVFLFCPAAAFLSFRKWLMTVIYTN